MKGSLTAGKAMLRERPQVGSQPLRGYGGHRRLRSISPAPPGAVTRATPRRRPPRGSHSKAGHELRDFAPSAPRAHPHAVIFSGNIVRFFKEKKPRVERGSGALPGRGQLVTVCARPPFKVRVANLVSIKPASCQGNQRTSML